MEINVKKNKSVKSFLACIAICVAMLSLGIKAHAATTYADRFENWSSNGYFKCNFQFIPAHVGTPEDPYCPNGKQIKQAYVNTGRVKWINGQKITYTRMYSSIGKKTSGNTITTPTAKIEDKFGWTEHTYYGFSLF